MLIQMDQGKHKSPLNVEEGVEEFESERYNVTKTHPDNAGFEDGKGPQAEPCGQSLGTGKGKETFSPRAPGKGHSPAGTSLLAQ